MIEIIITPSKKSDKKFEKITGQFEKKVSLYTEWIHIDVYQ